MPNPCGKVHMPNMPCRECDRARNRDATPPVKQEAVASPHIARKRPPKTPKPLSDSGPNVNAPSKAERIEVAREALTRAEISRRHREKDPEAYKKWNRERMKARRAKEKSG